MFHPHLIDPDVLLHHEHTRCTLVPNMPYRGRVEMACKEHSIETNETGLITRVEVCQGKPAEPRLLMMVLCPGCMELQLIKIKSGGMLNRVQAAQLPGPSALNGVDVILPDPEFTGEFRVGCASCSNGTLAPMLAEQWAVTALHDGGRRDVEVLLRCDCCSGAEVLSFAAIMDVGVGK